MARAELENLDATYVVQSGDRVYVALGDFFAARGSHAGFAIVDIRSPAKLAVLSVWKSEKRLRGSVPILGLPAVMHI